jgi:hypothetical protein
MEIIKKMKTNKKKKNLQINKILNININYNITFNNDKLILLDDTNKKILVSDFIFFGIYQNQKKLWIWANAIPGISKKQIKIIKDIKNKSYIFENDKHKSIQFIYQFLNSDVIEISDKDQLKLIDDLLLYITNSILILNPINKYGNIQYIGLTNILEKYI